MIQVRTSQKRGHVKEGWLNSYFTFSFAEYYDPRHMGFKTLRVINEDRVDAHQGFGMHPHRDMEIITYMISGTLEHKDSMGNTLSINAGDVQRMSAGTGVLHSEMNNSSKEAHLLQIWIFPEKKGIAPSYEQRCFSPQEKLNMFCLLVSKKKERDSLLIHQDVALCATILEKGKELEYPLAKDRSAWVQVVSGKLELNGNVLVAGDGAAIEHEKKLHFSAREKAEFLLFDLK